MFVDLEAYLQHVFSYCLEHMTQYELNTHIYKCSDWSKNGRNKMLVYRLWTSRDVFCGVFQVVCDRLRGYPISC